MVFVCLFVCFFCVRVRVCVCACACERVRACVCVWNRLKYSVKYCTAKRLKINRCTIFHYRTCFAVNNYGEVLINILRDNISIYMMVFETCLKCSMQLSMWAWEIAKWCFTIWILPTVTWLIRSIFIVYNFELICMLKLKISFLLNK